MAKERSTDFSMHVRAMDCIAGGALTNSKRPESLVMGVFPTHVHSGQGCFLKDTQGRQYVDFICGLGSNILGYAHPDVNSAVFDRLNKGVSLSLSTDVEVAAAEQVKSIFPFISKLRFLKTGSDACSAAIRIARAFNGRQTVLSSDYHGWHDAFVSLTPPATGVVGSHEIQKLISLDCIDETVSAVIIEPISTEFTADRIEWLRSLRKKCNQTGTVLIFDEVITGCRFPQFTVSKYYGIEPDLICLGKAIANGFPLSIVGGRRDIMDTPGYFVSSTFAGDTVSLAAMQTTLHLLKHKYSIEDLWQYGKAFQEEFNSFCPSLVRIDGYPTRGVLAGDFMAKALFMQEACKAGIIFGPSWFFNFAHIHVKDSVLGSCRDIISKIKSGGVKLEGEMPQSPFSQKVRES